MSTWTWVIGLAALAGYGGLAAAVIADPGPLPFDAAAIQWVQGHACATAHQMLQRITDLHETGAILAYVAVLTLLFLRVRRWDHLALLAASMLGGMLVNLASKAWVQRPRPVLSSIPTADSFSFPSGHTAAAALLYGFVVLWVWRSTPSPLWRGVSLVLAISMMLAVAASRVYLGVHYLSDVVAALLESTLWLAVCHTAARRFAAAA